MRCPLWKSTFERSYGILSAAIFCSTKAAAATASHCSTPTASPSGGQSALKRDATIWHGSPATNGSSPLWPMPMHWPATAKQNTASTASAKPAGKTEPRTSADRRTRTGPPSPVGISKTADSGSAPAPVENSQYFRKNSRYFRIFSQYFRFF